MCTTVSFRLQEASPPMSSLSHSYLPLKKPGGAQIKPTTGRGHPIEQPIHLIRVHRPKEVPINIAKHHFTQRINSAHVESKVRDI